MVYCTNEAAADSRATLGAFGSSTLTLVEPPPATARGAAVLVFAPDNMRNAAVHAYGAPHACRYTVRSNRELTVTEMLCSGTGAGEEQGQGQEEGEGGGEGQGEEEGGELLARIEYRTVLPDQVAQRSRGLKPVRISSWLQEIGSKP
jgi:hypothetical protein